MHASYIFKHQPYKLLEKRRRYANGKDGMAKVNLKNMVLGFS